MWQVAPCNPYRPRTRDLLAPPSLRGKGVGRKVLLTYEPLVTWSGGGVAIETPVFQPVKTSENVPDVEPVEVKSALIGW